MKGEVWSAAFVGCQGVSNQTGGKQQRQKRLRPRRALVRDPETDHLVLQNFSLEAAMAQVSERNVARAMVVMAGLGCSMQRNTVTNMVASSFPYALNCLFFYYFIILFLSLLSFFIISCHYLSVFDSFIMFCH